MLAPEAMVMSGSRLYQGPWPYCNQAEWEDLGAGIEVNKELRAFKIKGKGPHSLHCSKFAFLTKERQLEKEIKEYT